MLSKHGHCAVSDFGTFYGLDQMINFVNALQTLKNKRRISVQFKLHKGLFFCLFKWPHPWHTEGLGPRIKFELQLQRHAILNPLCWAGDQTHDATETTPDPEPTVP